eukprot:TRINITY_DN12210_c0_g1_i1.p1 TRINITY_DN12210_c0_g1~~TRINITY_DN12210_c0_g1_i1.p1  ORF type:complete len:396 (+),score=94.50 TRINITY_DN12210_c0_g1_i1:73-1260(+)
MSLSAYIVDAVRTAGGKKGGRLSNMHPGDLGAAVVNALLDRTKIDPAQVDDVIFGCVSQVGFQSANIGRSVVLSSKLPISVPGTTVDRQCGSGQQAIHFAAQAVMSGTQDCVIAGGVEIMSVLGIGSSIAGLGNPYGSDAMQEKYPGVFFSQFEGAEILAKKHNITRDEMEDLAVRSHARAHEATTKGYFKNEIIPIKVNDPKSGAEVIHNVDEGIRYPADKKKMSQLPLLKKDGGRLTAATASQITDGAAAILIVNERGLKKLGLKPRAKIITLSLAGSDPVEMLGAPIPATFNALKTSGLKISDIDLYEVNEAFASVPLSWLKSVGADINKLNVNGGAMALGHPLGATGVKLMATLVNELERRKGKYGLLAICEGGGTANATIIQRVETASKL